MIISTEKVFSYLQFLVKSTNQHGVHSPFVYNYITKGLYGVEKDRFIKHKTNQWLVQSIQYFKPNKIYIANKALLKPIEKISIEKTVELAEVDLILLFAIIFEERLYISTKS